MRLTTITSILVFCLGTSSATNEIEYAPFDLPVQQEDLIATSSTNDTVELDGSQALGLLRRQQGSCPSGYNACTDQSASGACCKANTICSLDSAGHVGCCPTNAACTGVINVGSQSGSSASTASGSSSNPSGFLVPATTTGAAAAAGTTISNSLYGGFIALPTSFPNAQVCSSAISSCTSEFQKCTAALGGNQNGVTITGNGASVSLQGATTNLGPSATVVCQSLSSQACRGSQLANCNGGNAATLGTPNAAPTQYSPLGYGVGVGVGVAAGFMAQVI